MNGLCIVHGGLLDDVGVGIQPVNEMLIWGLHIFVVPKLVATVTIALFSFIFKGLGGTVPPKVEIFNIVVSPGFTIPDKFQVSPTNLLTVI